MIAEISHLALWLAAICALFQLGLAVVEVKRTAGDAKATSDSQMPAIRGFAVAQGVLCVGAFLALIYLFVISDMSLRLVATHSHSDKPLIYKISGTWGNHEGSMLLWVTILTLSGALIALVQKSLQPRMIAATLGAQAWLSLGFFLFLLFASNPFARLLPPAPQGAGLNPMLQDPGLAFHPPTLYFGYVGLSIAFSFAVGALVVRDAGPAFARAMRPWVLLAWVFLTIGITAGSYWAYYELGWGGWWFWDPVENASLMPWLAATALFHSASVTAKRDALRAWTIVLALVAFSFSILGTFIVRSGLLTSVHAFAVDPTRGVFILGLMAIYIGGAFLLYALRISSVAEGKQFTLISREAGLVLNNLLFAILLAIVAFGTLYPMVSEAMGAQISVGPPYFNKATAPFALIFCCAMMIAPSIRWRGDSLRRIKLHSGISIALVLFALLMLAWRATGISLLSLLGLAVAAGLAVASFFPLYGRNLRRTPLPVWGMVIAHFGVAVALAGMASEASFTKERLAAINPGTTVTVGDWRISMTEVVPVVGPNWTAIEGRLKAVRGGEVQELRPQSRYFSNPEMETNEAALHSEWDGQLYAVLGQSDEAGRWQVRLWWKPYVKLIWFGGILLALGGLLALIGHSGVTQKTRRLRSRFAISKGYG
jgi:cytochrome c-type biogenesis protein CcmF